MMLAGLLLCMTETLSTCVPYLVPDPILSAVRANTGLSMAVQLNPAYLRGDFDGDGRSDYMVLAAPSAGDLVLLVCWGSGSSETVSPRQIVGAPPAMRFDFDGWEVIDSQAREYYCFEDVKPRPMGDEVVVIWAERGGGYLYRSAGSWHWYTGMDEP